jgi:hypothetical protein
VPLVSTPLVSRLLVWTARLSRTLNQHESFAKDAVGYVCIKGSKWFYYLTHLYVCRLCDVAISSKCSSKGKRCSWAPNECVHTEPVVRVSCL